eukprot:249054-Chlamydomonas_euryale.AAC.1
MAGLPRGGGARFRLGAPSFALLVLSRPPPRRGAARRRGSVSAVMAAAAAQEARERRGGAAARARGLTRPRVLSVRPSAPCAPRPVAAPKHCHACGGRPRVRPKRQSSPPSRWRPRHAAARASSSAAAAGLGDGGNAAADVGAGGAGGIHSRYPHPS